MTPAKTFQSGARQRGLSMIELLVAVLVLAIGVLGITALQMVSLQNNRGALFRAEAVQLAYDMMDRIRANPEGAVPGGAYSGLALADAPPGAPDCLGNQCTQAQMVAFDQAMWKCSLGSYHANVTCVALRAAGALPSENDQPGLPNGDGSIQVDGAGVVRVTVTWDEPDGQVGTVTIDSQG
ncbi:MAG: type IV pilus modification protein PilV [Pseudomonadales bacterium]